MRVLLILALLSIFGMGAKSSKAEDPSGLECVFENANISGLRPAILFLAGYSGGPEVFAPVAEASATKGYASLRCGYTMSDADQDKSVMQDLQMVLAAYDQLAAHSGVDAKNIGVVGTSLGGLLAVFLTEKREVKWLALHAPAMYPDADLAKPLSGMIKVSDEVYRKIPEYRNHMRTPSDNLALRTLSKFSREVLVVASSDDKSVPRLATDSYVSAAGRGVLRFIKGEHTLSEQNLQELAVILLRWLETTPRDVARIE